MTDEQMNEIKRHSDEVSEGLRIEIRQVAEGVVNVDEKLERFRQDVDESAEAAIIERCL